MGGTIFPPILNRFNDHITVELEIEHTKTYNISLTTTSR